MCCRYDYINQVKSLEIEDINHKINTISLANQAVSKYRVMGKFFYRS